MKFSLKKLAALGVSVIMAMSMSMSAFASTVGHTLIVEKKWVEATFNYTVPGNVLAVKINYEEKHRTTGQEYENSVQDVKSGAYTSVSTYKIADEGYDFTEALSIAYLNSVEYSRTDKMYP